MNRRFFLRSILLASLAPSIIIPKPDPVPEFPWAGVEIRQWVKKNGVWVCTGRHTPDGTGLPLIDEPVPYDIERASGEIHYHVGRFTV